MKKLLRTKFKSISILWAVFMVAFFQQAVAGSPLDSYKQLFRSWGLGVDTIDMSSDDNEDEEEISISSISKADPRKYLLLLSSQKNVSIGPYQNVILICDSSNLSNSAVSVPCSTSTLRDTDFRLLNPGESSASYKMAEIINPVFIDGVNYYVVPEILLVAPDYRSELADYFKALSKAEDVRIAEKEETSGPNLIDQINSLRDSMLYEIASYAVSILLIVIVAGGLLKILISDPKALLKKELYQREFNRFLGFINKNHSMFVFVFLVTAFLYIPIVYALNIRGNAFGVYQYASSYIKSTLNPANYQEIVLSKNIFRIGFLLYNYFLGVLFILVILPKTVSVVAISIRKVRSAIFKTNFIKWLVPAVVAFNLILLAFSKVEDIIGFLSFSIVVLFLVLFYVKNRKIDYAALFSKREQLLVPLVMAFILVFNFVFSLYTQKHPIQYSHEPLIGSSDNVVVFPYSKKWGENVLFEPHFYSGDSKIFADSYLIAAPGVKNIINKPLKQFSAEGSFTIVSGEIEGTIGAMLERPEILRYLESNVFSRTFVLDEFSRKGHVTAEITIDCKYDPDAETLKLEIYSLGARANDKVVNTRDIEILKFPGCSPEDGIKTYEVPVDRFSIPEDRSIVLLRGVDERIIIDFDLKNDGKPLPLRFMNKAILDERKYRILYQTPQMFDNVVSFSTGVKEETAFDIIKDEEGFDLSIPINQLMKEKLLNNPFIIWSDGGVEVVQR